MSERRPPVGTLTVQQISMVEWGVGTSSVLSIVGSTLIIGYIALRMILNHCKRRRGEYEILENPSSATETSFTSASSSYTSRRSISRPSAFHMWLLLWFSELIVLSLGISDLGSALWYFLNLHILKVPCSNAMGFLGTVFEPASVLAVTFVNVSMLVLLRKSLVLQKGSQIRNTLLLLLSLCFIVSWLLPIILAIVFYIEQQYGADVIYCWLSPLGSPELRLYSYYVPILILVVLNVILMALLVYNNHKLKMGLSYLSLLWVPVSLVIVWVMPSVSTIWSSVTSDTKPFPLILVTATMLPSQGFFNAVLFVILLGRERKQLLNSKTTIADDDADDGDDAFHVEELRLNIFGEKISWFMQEEE